MKYIMFEVRHGNQKDPIVKHMPVVFPDELVHALVKDGIMDVLREQFPQARCTAISAGFISGAFEDVSTYGKSESMTLAAVKEDAKTIMTYEYLHGIKT